MKLQRKPGFAGGIELFGGMRKWERGIADRALAFEILKREEKLYTTIKKRRKGIIIKIMLGRVVFGYNTLCV